MNKNRAIKGVFLPTMINNKKKINKAIDDVEKQTRKLLDKRVIFGDKYSLY